MLTSGPTLKLQFLRSHKVRESSGRHVSQTITNLIERTSTFVIAWTFLDLQILRSFFFMAITEIIILFGGNAVVCFVRWPSVELKKTNDGPGT